jgi:two-component system, OmpR family, response regulator
MSEIKNFVIPCLEYEDRLSYQLKLKLKLIENLKKLLSSLTVCHRIIQMLLQYMKILIIDDHPKIRENLSRFFTLQSISSDTAPTGEIGLAKTKETAFDLILLDMNMPIMGGRAFLQAFRTLDITTPVLVLTSDNTVKDIVEVLDLGADDYLTKPFAFEELLARIHAITRRRGSIVEATSQYGPYTINLRANTLSR